MMFSRNLMLLIASLFCLNNALSANLTEVVGKVKQVMIVPDNWSTYDVSSQSMLFIYIDNISSSCASQKRIAIGSNHNSYDSALSLALTAHATGDIVTLGYLDTCSAKSNSADFAFISLEPKG